MIQRSIEMDGTTFNPRPHRLALLRWLFDRCFFPFIQRPFYFRLFPKFAMRWNRKWIDWIVMARIILDQTYGIFPICLLASSSLILLSGRFSFLATSRIEKEKGKGKPKCVCWEDSTHFNYQFIQLNPYSIIPNIRLYYQTILQTSDTQRREEYNLNIPPSQ